MSMVQHVIDCIELAEKLQSKLPEDIATWYNYDGNEGMSTPKIRHLFNNLLDKNLCDKNNITKINYLEIGTWKGSIVIPALYKNEVDKYWLIDNYSEFIGGIFGNPYGRLVENFKLYLNSTPNLINKDSFKVDCKEYNIQDVNFYLYDGEHSQHNQHNGITYFIDAMADEFTLIVDDYDRSTVQAGTTSGLNQLINENKIKIEYSRYLTSTSKSKIDRWHDGIFVAVIKKI